MHDLKRNDLLYPELSFQIVGCAFEVHNELGFGFKESIYQKALALAFKEKKLSCIEQVHYQIKFKEQVIAKRYFDFVVEDKIVVEIKKDVIDNILDWLIAAICGGNIDSIRHYCNLYALKSGYDMSETAAILTDAMQKLDIGDQKSRDALAAAMSTGKNDASTRGEIQKIQNQLNANEGLKTALANALRDAANRHDSAQKTAEAMFTAAERTAQNSRWT
jgi:GxxExxY protein